LTWAVTLQYRKSVNKPPDLVVLTEAGDEEEALTDAQVLVNHGRKQLDWQPLMAQRIRLPNAESAP
jgi:hypothetical protein